jgi:hypothetical protein
LSEPGGGSGGLLVGRQLLGSTPLLPNRTPLHRIVETSEETATVEIHVKSSEGAEQVEVLGDFTLWEPVQMSKDGTRWSVQLEIPYGTHHFGFLVDGEWYLPDGAPDSVPDEWGRKNATIVVEGRPDLPPRSLPAPAGKE